ncbi:MAG: CmcI family methyltransferase [Acidobacteriota bacterium]
MKQVADRFVIESARHRYSYNFSWMGRPIIQYPQDIVALQEIIWKTRPSAIIETGVAHGGSLIFYASMLELLRGDGIVIGIDIDIRPHNRVEIESHPLSNRIRLVLGSSTDEMTLKSVRDRLEERGPVMVVLDSNHTAKHVFRELELYSGFVAAGSYLVVLDTIVERFPPDLVNDRPWEPGNSPMTAVDQFLMESDRFEVDNEYDRKLLISMAPRGYLRCVKN